MGNSGNRQYVAYVDHSTSALGDQGSGNSASATSLATIIRNNVYLVGLRSPLQRKECKRVIGCDRVK